MTPQIKKIMMNVATGAFILGVVIVGYMVFVKKDTGTATPVVVTPTLGVAQTVAVSTEISRTKTELSELKKAIASSVEVFSSREFRSLQDFSIEVPEEPIGRDNPFMTTDWKIKLKAEEAAAGKKAATSGGSSAPTAAATPAKPAVESNNSAPTGI